MTAAARPYKAQNKMKFSPQQQAAIDKRGVSVMLGAAAGSGKTTVMVSRIMKMLTDGDCTLDQLLVLTFTRAAASNMRTKLEKEAHALIPKCGGSILVLQEGYYDENTGLVPEAGQMDYMEV